MDYKVEKVFIKDIDKLNKKIKQNLVVFLDFLENAKNLDDISYFFDFKKLKSLDSYYRIRFGDYRLVFKSNRNEIILLRFKHRKDIYKSI